MPFTFRTDGSSPSNIIKAAWFNDIMNLLTGVMTDQPVSLFYNTFGIPSGSQFPVLTLKSNLVQPFLVVYDYSSNLLLQVDANGSLRAYKPTYLDNNQIVTDGNGLLTPQTLGFTATNGTLFKHAYISLPSYSTDVLTIQADAVGIKNTAGTKLFEVNATGNALVKGTVTTSAGTGSFDGFDYAEKFESQEKYEAGTVVCPGDDGLVHKCSHEKCPMACIVSSLPAFSAGSENEEDLDIALVGRVKVKTAQDLKARTPVVSDGRGGARALVKGESGYILGFTVEKTDETGKVGILIRNMWATY